MKFEMDVTMDNAAFDDEPATELKRILLVVADAVAEGQERGRVYDINGNTCGVFRVHNDN